MALQWLVLPLALLSAVVQCAPENRWRGLSPQMQQKLRSVSSFHCDNRQQQWPLSRLNDNYCDCKDGSDEPGTSACSHTKAVFHCENAGFFSTELPTSRVNDGVCDCCDASDEYASGASCASHCSEEMQSFVADREDLVQQVEAGLKDRVVLTAEVRRLWNEEELKIQQLEAEVALLRGLVEQSEEKVKDEERAEQEEKERRIAESKDEIMHQLGLLELTKEQLTSIILEIGREGVWTKRDLLPIIRKEREAAVREAEEMHKTPMDEEDEAFRERDEARQEETRRIEKLIEQRTKDEEKAVEEAMEALEEEAAATDGDEGGAEPDIASPVEDEKVEELGADDLELPEVEVHPIDLLYEELAVTERYESSQAVSARKEHEDAKKKVQEVEGKLLEAQTLMNKEYGVDRLFFGLRDKCVESSGGQYTYKVCLFGKATQDQTILGNMEDIKGIEVQDGEGSPEDSSAAGPIVKQVKFSNGQKCWNGPNRSLTVTLECGPEPMELSDIEEPSTCVYSAKLRTPVVCSEDDRKQILTLDDVQVAPHHIEVEVLPTL
uniref:Glucosidase 2 subunit beta n=1 Tax=Peronospora matthiolae TaxID=2874970 RepID=A0AAV1UK73_9STRA